MLVMLLGFVLLIIGGDYMSTVAQGMERTSCWALDYTGHYNILVATSSAGVAMVTLIPFPFLFVGNELCSLHALPPMR